MQKTWQEDWTTTFNKLAWPRLRSSMPRTRTLTPWKLATTRWNSSLTQHNHKPAYQILHAIWFAHGRCIYVWNKCPATCVHIHVWHSNSDEALRYILSTSGWLYSIILCANNFWCVWYVFRMCKYLMMCLVCRIFRFFFFFSHLKSETSKLRIFWFEIIQNLRSSTTGIIQTLKYLMRNLQHATTLRTQNELVIYDLSGMSDFSDFHDLFDFKIYN